MPDINDLLHALVKVHQAYKGDLDPNDDPDASENDPNNDPGNDDGDSNDDPRSYYPDDDDDDDGTGGYYPDDDKDDDEENFAMQLSSMIVTPTDRKQAALREAMKAKPKSRAQIKRNKLFELRRRNNEIRYELDIDRKLALETKRNEEAALALYRSNMTPEQKRQRDEDTRIMSLWAAGICKEASYTWWEDARLEFNQKKL
jgi:hypothetical protein